MSPLQTFKFVSSSRPNSRLSITLVAGQTIQLQRQSDTQYLIELPDQMTVKTVADIQSQLLAYDPIVAVVIDVAQGDATSK